MVHKLNTNDITPGNFALSQPDPTGTEVVIRAYLAKYDGIKALKQPADFHTQRIRFELQEYLEAQNKEWTTVALKELGFMHDNLLRALFRGVITERISGTPMDRRTITKNHTHR